MGSSLAGIIVAFIGMIGSVLVIAMLVRLSMRANKALDGMSAQRATILMLETRIAVLEKTVRSLSDASR
jgi:hypothetical protein